MVTPHARAFVLAAALAIGWSAGAVFAHPPQSLPGQRLQPPSGTASVTGTVVDSAQPPRPVRRARVTLRGDSSTGWSAMTNDEGGFTLTGIAAGRYVLEAQKAAWIVGRYGAARPGRPGTPIVVTDGAALRGLTIAMRRGSVISGTVINRSGEPVPAVQVSAIGPRGPTPGTNVVTDEDGRFRIFGLPPGEYRVVATPTWRTGPMSTFMELTAQTDAEIQASLRGGAMPEPRTVGFAPLYAPGVTRHALALAIRLGQEEERDGVTITLSPVPTTRITVTVDSGGIGDPASVQLSLSPRDAAGTFLQGRRGGDGRYIFAGVAAIPYTAIARGAKLGAAPSVTTPAAPALRGRGPAVPLTLYAIEDLEVSGGEMNVSLRLQAGLTVSGRVVAEPGAVAPRVSDVNLALYPQRASAGVGVPSARTGSDGAFTFEGVLPGRYLLTPSATPSARPAELKSAPYRGLDVLDLPFEVIAGEDITNLVVTLTARPTELTGRLATSTDLAAPDYHIVVFAVDKRFWTPQSRRVRQTRPASDGRFSITGLPAGEYLIAALTDVEPDEWKDALFLESLTGVAVPVTLRDGATTTQDLRIR